MKKRKTHFGRFMQSFRNSKETTLGKARATQKHIARSSIGITQGLKIVSFLPNDNRIDFSKPKQTYATFCQHTISCQSLNKRSDHQTVSFLFPSSKHNSALTKVTTRAPCNFKLKTTCNKTEHPKGHLAQFPGRVVVFH